MSLITGSLTGCVSPDPPSQGGGLDFSSGFQAVGRTSQQGHARGVPSLNTSAIASASSEADSPY
eukprot:5425650-Pleurochrysis_carterae.AAC.1